MSICSKCGSPVEFRYVNGRCIPFHRHGGCNNPAARPASPSPATTPFRQSRCVRTVCPHCGKKVFFIQHNGGSVWIEPPLGPPWPKHACFAGPATSSSQVSLAAEYKIDLSSTSATRASIGIVSSSHVRPDGKSTELLFERGNTGHVQFVARFNASYLLGKLCIHSPSTNEVWALDAAEYRFSLLSGVNHEMLNCPICKTPVSERKLARHLRRVHGQGTVPSPEESAST